MSFSVQYLVNGFIEFDQILCISIDTFSIIELWSLIEIKIVLMLEHRFNYLYKHWY